MKRIYIVLWSLMLILPLTAQESPRVIAHRGFWQTFGSAQNSITSFERAAELGLYGTEFDVHMTADSVLVVFHDASVQGMKIQDVTYSMLKDIKLQNGECIPTLRELLECARRTDEQFKLIFELKPHATPEKDFEAARRSVELIQEKKLTHRTEYITFSMDAGKALIKLSPSTPVYYLNGNVAPKELKELGYAGLDYHYNVMREHSEWFKEAHQLGLGVNVWTVDDLDIMQEMANFGADFITTNVPNEAMKLFKK